jgi:hypothetical protein
MIPKTNYLESGRHHAALINLNYFLGTCVISELIAKRPDEWVINKKRGRQPSPSPHSFLLTTAN